MQHPIRNYTILIVLVGLAYLLVSYLAPVSTRVLVPTTNVTILPPVNYKVSFRFPGVEDVNTDGSFTVNSFPVQAIGSLGEMFSSVERATPTLNNRGIVVEGTETITWNDNEMLLFRGTQKDDAGVLYEKWIAVYIKERPIMVAFQEPRPGKLTRQQVIDAFASVVVNDDLGER